MRTCSIGDGYWKKCGKRADHPLDRSDVRTIMRYTFNDSTPHVAADQHFNFVSNICAEEGLCDRRLIVDDTLRGIGLRLADHDLQCVTVASEIFQTDSIANCNPSFT